MIAQLEGIVAEKRPDSLVLDVNGIGFFVNASVPTMAAVPQPGERIRLYTVLIVREDAMDLYGFAEREEQRMFDRLRSVSGVGPRTAQQMLSSISTKDLTLALVTGDAGILTKAPGIGKKTAQRVILELKDKIGDEELKDIGKTTPAAVNTSGDMQEAIAALIGLGYSSSEATKAVAAVSAESKDVNQMIFQALKSLSSL